MSTSCMSLGDIEAILSKHSESLQRIEQILISGLPQEKSNFVTVSEAEKISGFSRSLLYKISVKREVETKKEGGKLLFDRASLEIWMFSKQQKRGGKNG